MNKTEIYNIHKSIVKLIYSGKLYEACSKIKQQDIINQSDSSSSLSMVEETYKLMLKYSVVGMKDPNRDKIFKQLQVSLLMMADSVRNRLMKKYQHSDIFSTVDYPVPSDSPNDNNVNDWFYYLVHNELIASNAETILSNLKTSDKLSWESLSLLVSAITLSLTLFFDIKKFKILVSWYLDNQAQIWQRALFGIFITSYLFNKRLKLYPETNELFRKLVDSKDFKERYHLMVIQFIKAISTDKITKKINEEILPEVSKLAPGIKDKMKSDSSNIENFDEENPEWGNYLEENPELLDKMAEVSKMQMDGSDVFINTFAMLKTFSFFNRLENWFLPYSPQNKAVTELLERHKGESFDFKSFAERLNMAPFICNSDKYSFCLSVSMMPDDQRQSLGKYFNGELSQLDDIHREDLLLHQKELSYKALTQYVQDIYRFSNLNRFGKEFPSFFDKSFSPIGTMLFDYAIDTCDEKRKIGEYFFANEYYKQAFDIFKAISLEEPNFQIFQKMGYAAQKLGDNQLALDYFLKAQLFDDQQLWNLKKIGFCYRKLKNPERALEFYRLAEAQDPDNLSIATSIGRCLLETENYEEALKYYFKVEYLDPKNVKIYRPIAWCSYEMGKYEQALKYCNKISKSEKSPEDFVLAGHASRKLNDTESAMNYYSKALEYQEYTVAQLEEAMKTDYYSESSEELQQETNLILDYLMYKKDNLL